MTDRTAHILIFFCFTFFSLFLIEYFSFFFTFFVGSWMGVLVQSLVLYKLGYWMAAEMTNYFDSNLVYLFLFFFYFVFFNYYFSLNLTETNKKDKSLGHIVSCIKNSNLYIYKGLIHLGKNTFLFSQSTI